jgi:DNA polymerase V
MEHTVRATGFASPAQGYEVKSFDFNQLIVTNPPATFVMRCATHDMEGRGIKNGDLLVIDRSQKPSEGACVVIAYEGAFLCRAVSFRKNRAVFLCDRGEISPDAEHYEFFGVIKAVVRLC